MKMEFINFEADDVDQDQNDKELDLLAEIDDFIDDESVQEESEEPCFYRFVNQTRNFNEALNCDDGSGLERRDLQPEMFISKGRENVDFHEFEC